jgi:hypothetical protein
VVEEDLGQETAPEHFALLPNYPNPFADQTTLRYTLETPAQVQLVIYNTLGQPVRHLVDDYQSEGLQEVVWQCRNQDGQRVASGLYMSHLEVPGQFNQSRKMMLLAGGFARIDRLDERLQRAGADWSVLETDLAAAPEVDFGGIATPSTRQAAFTAGMLWVRLQVAGQYRPAGLRLQRHARRLTQMVELLDPVAAGLAEQLQNLRAEAATGERLGWVRRELETLVQDLGEAEAVYFYLGEWLESLRTTGLAAWRLSEPLGQVGDPAADATAARQFGVLLVAQGADPGLVEVLDQVGDALAADPRARGEVVALVGLLDSIADGLALR